MMKNNNGYPVKRLVVPKRLKKFGNGLLPERLLAKTDAGGLLYRVAAIDFNRMYAHAQRDGVILRSVGAYRSLERQEQMFRQRMTRDKSKAKQPLVRRIWKGKIWYLAHLAPVAVPSRSNHGWGLAIDLNLTEKNVLPWLLKNAPTYGFYLQGKPFTPTGKPNPEYEPWHWQKVDA
jgi:LAS superfamily LD-carboxypeptidase LdcB